MSTSLSTSATQMLNLHYAILGSQPTLTQLNAYAGTYKKAQTAGATADGALDAVATVILDSDAAINALMPNLAAPKTLATKLLANVGITNAAIVDFIAGFLDGTSNGGKPFPLSTAAVVISNYVASYKTGTSAYTAWDADLVAAQKVHSARAVPEPTGQTFTLTTGVDTVAGGVGPDSIFGTDTGTATTTTFGVADAIDGGAGTDTLALSLSNATAQSYLPTRISNVEKLSVTNTSAVSHAFDLVSTAGLSSVESTGSSGGVSFSNLSSPSVSVGGGNTASAVTATIRATALTGTADEANIALTGYTGIVSVSSSASGTGDVETVKVTSSGAASTPAAGSILGGSAITKITVAGDAALNLGSVTIPTTVRTMDASAKTAGGVTFTTTNTTSSTLTGGAGADVLTGAGGNDVIAGGAGNDTLNGALGNDSIDGGAGDDRILISASGALTKDDTIDGGDGTDTIAFGVSLAAVTTGTQAGAGVKNVETVESTAAAISVALNAMPSATITGGLINTTGAGLTLTGAGSSLASLTLKTDGSASVTMATASNTTADSISVALGGTASGVTVSSLSLADYETISISSGGSTNAITSLVGTAAKTINITGSKALTLTTDETAVALSKVDASAFTGSTLGVTASASTAAMTVTTGAGAATITTGTGADTITSGAGNDIITSGTGNDWIVTGDGADTVDSGLGNDYIDGGSGNDSLTAGGGSDTIIGGDGENTISAGIGDDSVTAGDGNDTIDVSAGNDTVVAGGGNDGITLTSFSDGDSINGGLGTDTVTSSTGVTDSVTPAALTSIEELRMTGGIGSTVALTSGTVDLDLKNVTDLKTLRFVDTTATNGGVQVKSIPTSATSVWIKDSGGVTTDTVTLKYNGTGSVTVNLDTYNASNNTGTTPGLTVNNGGTLTLVGLTSTDYTGTARTTYTNVSSTGALTTTATDLVIKSNALTAATNQSQTELTVGQINASSIQTFDVSNGIYTDVTVGLLAPGSSSTDLRSIAATANTGGTVTLGGVTAAGATNIDSITLAAKEAGTLVNTTAITTAAATVAQTTITADGGGVLNLSGAITAAALTKVTETFSAGSTLTAIPQLAGTTIGAVTMSVGSGVTATQAIGVSGGGATTSVTASGLGQVSLTLLGTSVGSVNLSGLTSGSAQTVTGTALTSTTVGTTFTGSPGVDNFTGGAGPDTFAAGLGANVLDGGAGSDTADLSAYASAITLTLNTSTAATVVVGSTNTGSVVNIENIIGTALADTITGDSAANYIQGGALNDTISGGGAADTLSGGTGADVISGGSGADSLIGGGGRDQYVIGTAGDSAATSTGRDIITDFGLVTTATTAAETLAMTNASTFQASATAKGGSEADLLKFSAAATLGGAQTATSVNTAAMQAADATTPVLAGSVITATETAKGVLTLGGANASLVDTLAEWIVVADVMAATAGDVVVFEFGGSTYVFQQGTTDDLVMLSGVTGSTGVTLIGASNAAAVGDIFVGG